jgi:hypothetical protein
MKDMSMDMERFVEEGGTEMAPMSTTKSEKVAKQYGPRSDPSISPRIASLLGIKFLLGSSPPPRDYYTDVTEPVPKRPKTCSNFLAGWELPSN